MDTTTPLMFRGKEKEKLELPRPVLAPTRTKSFNKLHAGKPPTTIVFNWRVLAGLFTTWLLLIHYFERTNTKSVINSCQWNQWESWDEGATPHRVVFIADPQIVDDYSYANRPRFINYLIKKVTDNYLYRNNKFVQHFLDPDTTFFLGDLFDGGREWDDDNVWFEEYKRFSAIYPKKPHRRTYQGIPGNHDIGFEKIEPHKLARFNAFFGDTNDYVEIGNHSIVLLDTISLSSKDPEISTPPTKFLESLNDRLNPQLPRILLLHVPLARFPDQQLCGPHRESKRPFPLQRGYQYQTIIEHHISQTVLTTVHPEIAFAGDDHDYCDIQQPYVHNGESKMAREITVKSCAMSGGIKRPAIQLLSLNNPYDPASRAAKGATFETEMCYMPLPYLPFKIYGVLFVLSIALMYLLYLSPQKLDALKRAYTLPKWAVEPGVSSERNLVAFLFHGTVATAIPIFILGVYYWSI